MTIEQYARAIALAVRDATAKQWPDTTGLDAIIASVPAPDVQAQIEKLEEVIASFGPVERFHLGTIRRQAEEIERFKKQNEHTREQIDAARASWMEPCDICCGTGKVIGAPCACGGSGKLADALKHARLCLMDVDKQIDAARADEREGIRFLVASWVEDEGYKYPAHSEVRRVCFAMALVLNSKIRARSGAKGAV